MTLRIPPTIWYENEDGDRFVPEDTFEHVPKPGSPFRYFHSRIPLEVREQVGAIRRGGKYREIGVGNTTFPGDLVLAITRPTASERARQVWRALAGDLWRSLTAKPPSMMDAVLLASTACERCLNVLGFEFGLPWGYAYGSPEWTRCNTSCELCKPPRYVSAP